MFDIGYPVMSHDMKKTAKKEHGHDKHRVDNHMVADDPGDSVVYGVVTADV
jgi:hypothetical protein